MKNLIWGVAFFLIQNWLKHTLGKQLSSTTHFGFNLLEAAENSLRRLLLFLLTSLAAGITGIIGLYYVLQTLRHFLEVSLGWDPAIVTAAFAIIFLSAGALILTWNRPGRISGKFENQLPTAVG